MPRPPRIAAAGLTLHVMQRGNDRGVTFRDTTDFQAYLRLLSLGLRRYETHVHAYVLMTNHVHLLMTSQRADGISRTMQYVGSRYSQRFNERYERTGTLWEGRFRSSPIDSERYCLACYRYIELNPIRARLAPAPGDYRWSSYAVNAEGRPSSLITPHPSFVALARTPGARTARYRELVEEALPDDILQAIRIGLRRGRAAGHEAFRSQVEAVYRRASKRPRGRPRKLAPAEPAKGRNDRQ